jgi:hypothetical protein
MAYPSIATFLGWANVDSQVGIAGILTYRAACGDEDAKANLFAWGALSAPVALPETAPLESGHPPRLQEAIIRPLGPDEFVAYRSRPIGAERYDFGPNTLPNKPEGAQTITENEAWELGLEVHSTPDGMRVVHHEGKIKVVVSDLDPAWAVRDGRLMEDDDYLREIGNSTNAAYGAKDDVVQHGHHVNGVRYGKKGAKVEYLLQKVYIYGPKGFVKEGPMLEMLEKYAPNETAIIAELRAKLRNLQR